MQRTFNWEWQRRWIPIYWKESERLILSGSSSVWSFVPNCPWTWLVYSEIALCFEVFLKFIVIGTPTFFFPRFFYISVLRFGMLRFFFIVLNPILFAHKQSAINAIV